MSLVLNALILAALASLIMGLIVMAAARCTEALGAPLGVATWRVARLAILLPFIAGPVLSQVPQERLMARPAVDIVPFADPHPGELVPLPSVDSVAPGLDWGLIAAVMLWLIYGAGLSVALMGALQRHYQRRAVLRDALPASARLQSMLRRLAAPLEIKDAELKVSDAVQSAVLTGWRGVILVPPALEADPEAARHVLLHELTHLKRGDERERLVGTALKTLLWFHWPLRQIEKHLEAAREIACDAGVVSLLGRNAAKPYAATLISMMKAEPQPACAFGTDSRRFCEMRIKAIVSGRSSSRRTSVVFLLLGGLAVSPIAFAQSVLTDRVERFVPVYLPSVSETAMASSDPRPILAALPPTGEVEVQPILIAGEAALAAPAPLGAPAPTPQPVSTGTPLRTFSHPVSGGSISSVFGQRPSRPGGAPKFHHGVDVAGPTGTDVKAVEDGIIIHAEAGYNGHESWGNTIVIDHGDGWQTLYAHLHDFEVEVGDRVSAGERIGGMGATGRATGPHVHVEVHYNGERMNPADHIPGLEHT